MRVLTGHRIRRDLSHPAYPSKGVSKNQKLEEGLVAALHALGSRGVNPGELLST
jgi:hypothetical protein